MSISKKEINNWQSSFIKLSGRLAFIVRLGAAAALSRSSPFDPDTLSKIGQLRR